jgi:hypothetical protein
MDTKEEFVQNIVNQIEELAKLYFTHPNDSVKLFAASRLVDDEVMIRMGRINIKNKENDVKFVGY